MFEMRRMHAHLPAQSHDDPTREVPSLKNDFMHSLLVLCGSLPSKCHQEIQTPLAGAVGPQRPVIKKTSRTKAFL
jgi:hypothetical protein